MICHSSIDNILFLDYLRQQQQKAGSGQYPPRSGYEELDTTLMPPRPGGEQFARNTPSPGPGQGHPGYAGQKQPLSVIIRSF